MQMLTCACVIVRGVHGVGTDSTSSLVRNEAQWLRFCLLSAIKDTYRVWRVALGLSSLSPRLVQRFPVFVWVVSPCSTDIGSKYYLHPRRLLRPGGRAGEQFDG